MLRLSLLLVGVVAAHSIKASQIKAAPYFMPLDNDPQQIDDIVTNSGIRQFILAFVLGTNDGECVPTWNGAKNLNVEADTHVLDIVRQIRSHGGDISISFGGYNGVELGHVCNSPEQLAQAYQAVIDKYQLTHVDFDIEGDDLGPDVEETRRFQAIKILKETAKSKGKQLHVTLTMPCTTIGLSDLGKAEIKRAIEAGAVIDLYKIMAFDYGGPGDSMAQSVISVMEQVHQQIKTLRTDLTTDAEIYQHTGIILMNGHTDQASEMFTQSTFEGLVQYSMNKNYGRVSYWALNRDRPCPTDGKLQGWASGICSSIPQQPYEFSKIVAKFDSSSPNVDPVTSAPTKAPQPEPTTKAGQETTDESAQTQNPNVKDVDCEHTEGEQYFPFRNDCHKYIRCYSGLAHILECPPGTIYDLQLHLCNWEADVHRPECK